MTEHKLFFDRCEIVAGIGRAADCSIYRGLRVAFFLYAALIANAVIICSFIWGAGATPARLCQASLRFYETVRSLPQSERILAARGLFQGLAE